MSDKSPALQLLDLVWFNTNAGHSWERLNHAMREALRLVVGSGFTFEPKDMDRIFDNYRAGRWIGDAEWVYMLAITVGNASAVASFEAAKGRKPFIADDVDPRIGRWRGGEFVHVLGKRKRERLAVGFEFPWRGETVTVTSFAGDSASLTACSYHEGDDRKVKHRHTITRADIIADRKERKGGGR